MTITDQQLCAFIDNELPAQEMDAIRDVIASDETIADRVAELTMVDHLVSSTVHAIDDKPLPQSTEQLMAGSQSSSPSNVIEMSFWRKASHSVREHIAIAAVFILTFGVTIGVFLGSSSGSYNPDWDTISQHLTQKPSDQVFTLDSQWDLNIQASFINTKDDYCRLFTLRSTAEAHINIACNTGNSWQLHSRLPTDASSPDTYRTASVHPELDALLDSTLKGSFLNRSQEIEAINNNWKSQ